MEQLKLQMEKNFSKTMMDNLFHSDFKFHIKAIEALIKVCWVKMANKNKKRSFKSSKHIHEKRDGPYHCFGYSSLFSDRIDLATWSQRELL